MTDCYLGIARRLIIPIALVLELSGCSLSTHGDAVTNEPFHKWIVVTWSIPPIGTVKIDSILVACHLEPGGFNKTGVGNLNSVFVTSIVIPVSEYASNKPVAANCQFVLQQSPQWASTTPQKYIDKLGPAVTNAEKVIRLHIKYEPEGVETEYLPSRFVISHKPN
ncbi:MAG TPA: hypothetical protein PKK23_20935 [Nitrospirales bacterium]|nr:hypothetical protein [Nitrospiraceae bacterium]HNP31525.1 hypothetical protein [Nitrospirales bacterium]